MEQRARTTLPPDPTPVGYSLKIQPDYDHFTYRGQVTIRLNALDTFDSITLHCVDLDLGPVHFQAAGKPSVEKTLSHTTNVAEETVTFHLPTPFTGDALLTIRFSRAIRNDLFGFYRSKYTDPSTGTQGFILCTQFCPVEARRTFPCWDEPARKATFALSLYAPPDMDVLFNVPHSRKARCEYGCFSERVDSPLVRWDFPSTPPMSTYLVAWAVGQFDYMERVVMKTHDSADCSNDPAHLLLERLEDPSRFSKDETVIRVVTSPGKAHQGAFALRLAERCLAWYEKAFGSNYPLPRLDLFAAPDFAFGGMENFGLVFLRETVVLCDGEPTANRMASIATVVAHEISHMWFGDVVSMQWWKELWLNESFAVWVTNVTLHELFPEWGIESQFMYEEGSRAYTLDALRSSHPIEMEISSAKQLDDVFDAISYAKGACVLRMLMHFLGQDVFFKGIRLYLSRHRYGNATTVDLWRSLGEAARMDLRTMMANWTSCQGFPYVTVSSASGGNNGEVELTQHRFLAGNDVEPSEDLVVWQLPLINEFGPDAVEPMVLSTRSVTVRRAAAVGSVAPYVKVNKDRSALCRVLYSEQLLNNLLSHIHECSNLDRFALLSDYAAFARGGYCSTELALAVLSNVKTEEDFTVLCESFDFTRRLRALMSTLGSDARQALDAYVSGLYATIASKIGYRIRQGDTFLTGRLRAELFDKMVLSRDPEAVAVARAFYTAEMERGEHEGSEDEEESSCVVVPGDQRGTVYAAYAYDNGEEGLINLMHLAAHAQDSMDRANYLRGLSGTRVPNAVPRLFDFALSADVRAQDLLHLLVPLAGEAEHAPAFARELIARWPSVATKAPGVMQTRIVNLTKHAADAAIARELRTFHDALSETDRTSIGSSLRQAIESIELNAAWVARDGDVILKHIRSCK